MLTEEILDQQVDAFLAHYGAKGMKWGVRKSKSERGPSGRQLNKASRQKDKRKYEASVDNARGRIASGATKRNFKKAKGEHAANKAKLGSREARKILNKAREKKYNDINTSQQARDGKEVAAILAVGAVGAVLMGILGSQ